MKYARSTFPSSRIATAVNRSTGRAPFASTLRPNLTGGTLGRTAGGYGTGSGRIGGARYFSHTPAVPAQVISNVSQAVRAFCLSGQKALYDGTDPKTGSKRYKAVSAMQEKVMRTMDSVPKPSPGSFVDFNVNPTITALTPLNAVAGFSSSRSHPRPMETLNTDGLLDVLSVDFSRALKELAAILNDLKRLSSLGDLPITYQSSCLRVHFPGCDADTVENLAVELGLQRGVIGQDDDFDAFAGTEIELLFPFASSKTVSEIEFYDKPVGNRYQFDHWLSGPDPLLFSEPSEREDSTRSDDGFGRDFIEVKADANPWLESSPSGYESVHSSELDDSGRVHERESSKHTPLEYQGIEGIYRFMEFCDEVARK